MGRQPEDLLAILAGEWEITCEETKAPWGVAVVNSLEKGLLVKRERDGVKERIRCTFENSSCIKLLWGRKGGRVSASLVDYCSEWLRWRLKPHSNGQERGCALWRRKSLTGSARKSLTGTARKNAASYQADASLSTSMSEDDDPSCVQPLQDVTNTPRSAAAEKHTSLEAADLRLEPQSPASDISIEATDQEHEVAVEESYLEEEARRSWQRVQLKAQEGGEMQWQRSSPGSEPQARSPSPQGTPARKRPRRSPSPQGTPARKRPQPSPKARPQTPARSPKACSRTPSPDPRTPMRTPMRTVKKARIQTPGATPLVTPMKKKMKTYPPPQEAPELTPEKNAKMCSLPDVPEQTPPEEDKPKSYQVLEVVSREHKQQTWELHSGKGAFCNELDQLQARISDNEEEGCRSWLLAQTDVEPQQASSKGSKLQYIAAITVRLNPYMRKAGLAWAQVMNLSVSRERQGHGTRLVAAVEELLQREGVDVIALYPVQNSRATNFWASMAFCERPKSLLPAEELDSRNGALLPEGCKIEGEKVLLPRWEKALKPNPPNIVLFEARWRIELDDGSLHMIDTQIESTWKPLKRVYWPLWRKTVGKFCKMNEDEIAQKFEAAQKQKLAQRDL